ncbi:hypothetical protein SDC9_42697 [bioreactor metagenome]|uniref:Uncharacterized protein n=1 Tax=bioreactor metagenome TaxID=1076179 RepID=A0A644VYG1_9ZZZZ|nr:hypothetical protein [Dehalococcoides mccartyi]
MTSGMVILAEIRTETEQGRPAPTPGWEWTAGDTPRTDPSPGTWFVRRMEDCFAVCFRSKLIPELKGNWPEYQIITCPPTEAGEYVARETALKLRNESYRQEAERNGHSDIE